MEKNELLKVKMKYSVKYVLCYKLFDVHLVSIILIICLAVIGKFLTLLWCLFLYFFVLAMLLFLYKKSASNTNVTFYQDKIVYVRKFLFINKREEMKYDDIKEIAFFNDPRFFAKFWQKQTNMGNMVIYPKKGNVIFCGISINNVYPLDKIIEDVKNKIGDKIK